jgi:hypothetical protein
VFADPKLQFRTEKRSYTNFKRSYVIFLNRRFGGVDRPEGLEDAPDILTENFLEMSALTIRAQPSGREPGWAAPKKVEVHEVIIVRLGR